MAVTSIPGVGPLVQWTIDQLFTRLRAVQADAEREWRTISTNNGRLIVLNQAADKVNDAAQRAQLKAWVQRSVARQVDIVHKWRATSAKVAELAKRVGDFLRAHGLTPSAGLGIAPLVVPAAILALAAASIAAVAFVHEMNAAQNKALDLQEQGLSALVHAGATPQQIRDYMARAEQSIKATQPKGDPFGLTSLVQSLGPIVFVLAAVALAPPLLAAFRGRR